MRRFSFIVVILLSVYSYSCLTQSDNDINTNKKVEDISVKSYKFITDTFQIKNLIKNTISPSGLPYQANKMINRFVEICLKNNLNDTIYLSKNPMDSLILSYSPITSYSRDSIIWEKPSGVKDYFSAFTEPIPPKQIVNRILFLEDVIEYAKYFGISVHYIIHDTLKSKLVILKK